MDNRDGVFPVDDFDLIKHLCDRKFGVGADGFMTLERSSEVDFGMKYFNICLIPENCIEYGCTVPILMIGIFWCFRNLD